MLAPHNKMTAVTHLPAVFFRLYRSTFFAFQRPLIALVYLETEERVAVLEFYGSTARVTFALIMVLYNLRHYIGFGEEWGPGVQAQWLAKDLIDLTGNPSKFTGGLWLVLIFFVLAAIMYFIHRDFYWMPAVAGIIVSQALVIRFWSDAKYGTIINAILLIVVAFSTAAIQFNSMVRREVGALIAHSEKVEGFITPEMIASFPQAVQRWLHRSGVVGKRSPHILRVVQKGILRTKPDGRWMPFQSIQHFSINPPAFVWAARIKGAPLLNIAGRDKYHLGRGHMLIRPLYLFTASDSRGKEIDQGTLLRYLAEMAWFPQAAVSPYLRWERLDDNSARVTMEYGGVSASGIFFFDPSGLVQAFEARRYREFERIYRKETWSVSISDYNPFNGILVGSRNEVTWKLKEGHFTWLRMEVTDIQPVDQHV